MSIICIWSVRVCVCMDGWMDGWMDACTSYHIRSYKYIYIGISITTTSQHACLKKKHIYITMVGSMTARDVDLKTARGPGRLSEASEGLSPLPRECNRP